MTFEEVTSTVPNSDKVYTLEEFFDIFHPLERILHMIYFHLRRGVDNRFQCFGLRLFYTLFSIIALDSVFQIIKIYQYVREGRLSEAQQVGAILSIEMLVFARGLFFFVKSHDLADFVNEFDKIFPRTFHLQSLLELPKIAVNLKSRFRYLYIYTFFAVWGFSSIPLVKYLLFCDRTQPIADEYHQNPSWVPFGLKQSHRFYPLMYLMEYCTTITGFSFIIGWDRVYIIPVTLMCMQYKFLCRQILQLDAKDTNDPKKAQAFYKHLKELMAYQRHLNRLGQDLNKIFNISILATDGICASAICFHFYLVLNTVDPMAITLFILPPLVLIFFLYDVAKQGTFMEDVSSEVIDSLYTHNWYEGSKEYRRLVALWMRHTYVPFRFFGFTSFEVSMAHFQQMMTLTYQMLAFLQSRE